jgi:hypothetical protein
VEAYVLVLGNKATLEQKLGKSRLNENKDGWDFMSEIKRAREKCAEDMAAENARKLIEDYELDDNNKSAGRGKGKRK